jgi:hypothetical protein
MNPVIESTRFLVDNLQHVKINPSRLEAFASELRAKELSLPRWNEPNYPGDDVDPKQFFVLVDSMNFAFNNLKTGEKWSAEYKDKTWPGSQGYVACLTRALEEGRPLLDPRYLRKMTSSPG